MARTTITEEKMTKDRAIVIMFCELLHDQLKTFEEKFDSDKKEFNAEQMQRYITASKWMRDWFDRKEGQHLKVKTAMNQLSF